MKATAMLLVMAVVMTTTMAGLLGGGTGGGGWWVGQRSREGSEGKSGRGHGRGFGLEVDAGAQAYCTGSDVGGECVGGTYTTGDNRPRTRINFFRAVQAACPDETSPFSLNDDDKPFLCAKGEGTFSVCCVDDDE